MLKLFSVHKHLYLTVLEVSKTSKTAGKDNHKQHPKFFTKGLDVHATKIWEKLGKNGETIGIDIIYYEAMRRSLQATT